MDDNGNLGNLIIIGIIVLLLIVVMAYLLVPKNDSYAIFTDEVYGDKTISIYYSEDNTSSGARYLITNMVGKQGFTKITHNIEGELLQINGKEIVDYRYVGSDEKVTNNYVRFNDELYRIVGVFNVVSEQGDSQYRIKIVKNKAYGSYDYNSESNNFVDSNIKDTLDKYFNKIKEEDKLLVGYSTYYLGGYSSSNTDKESMYKYERKMKNDDILYFAKAHENTNSIITKAGLLYASDYAYAADCDQNMNNLNSKECTDNNWLYKNDNMWLLNQNSSDEGLGFIVSDDGKVWSSSSSPQTYVKVKYSIYPVLYLNTNVNIKQGDGSIKNPYVFK